MTDHTTLDVREIPKPQRHPQIFGIFRDLAAGDSLLLVNDHDPRHLHDEFEASYPGSYAWEYVRREHRDYQVRISKVTSTPLPRKLTNLVDAVDTGSDAAGVRWKLDAPDRGLDSNVIALAPRQQIARHTGAEVDVLIQILGGDGTLGTEGEDVALAIGDLIWLPHHSQREFTAGPTGLTYLTVHRHRESLVIEPFTPR
ncbi:DUF2249 domain-containing protein [Gordonia sp. TBRC 11910]|uniref:DUF2249 domain-containing protein n=1 Tax=Gordonia asplenii TaxID=2725283 RepID=A0A848L6X7_9ACTN|nr:DUF2249 domain-containing protein [Gordonia asplenii]NMO04453.1 DUF2249 domain-containing protein [Gordonia asplenii]